MVKPKNFIFLIIYFFLFLSSHAFSKNIYNASNSSFEIILEKDSIFEERELFVLAKFNLDENWHTYWINPGDSGEPVNFDWILPKGFKISDPVWPSPELIPYPPLTTFGYTNELTLLFKISIPENIKKINEFSVTSRWLVCADVCIPQEGTVIFSLNEGNYSRPSDVIDAINEVKTKIPEKINNPIPIKIEKNQLFIDLDFLNTKTDEVIFFPFQENILDYSVTQRLENNSEKIILVATLDNYGITSELTGGVLKTKDASYEIEFLSPQLKSLDTSSINFISLSTAILFSLIGGLLLNLMPCVFPVISLKILNFINHSENKTQTTLHGLSFSSGAILMFILIGLSVVFLKYFGMDIGWGYQLQSPLVVSLLIFLFIFLAGFFLLNVNFLNSLLSIGPNGVSSSGYSNSFGTGFLAVIVATPCTAPFMGSALGFAILQPGFSSFFIFLSLGIGFSLPYIMLSIFPSILNFLPKPGLWMETFKQFMAFPMILTALWLIWVLSSQIDSFQLILIFVGITLIVFFYWLNQLEINSLSGNRLRYFLYLSIIISLVSILPLKTTQSEIFEESFNEEFLSEKISEGPVFLNFTADWCITCKVNERVALKTTSTEELFKEKSIFYMEADWTNKNDSIARKLASFGRSSIPLYVFYPGEKSEPIILPEILSESILREYLK